MIALRMVSKNYHAQGGIASSVLALQNIDLVIPDGEFVSVVGPSGCGKTTLLNLVAGFEFPTLGEVLLDNRPITGPGKERAVVFQQPSLLPWMTVEDNIAFGSILQQGRRGIEREQLRHMIRVMGLEGFEHAPPYHLSGGMQQRVAIARALLTDPEMLLMDEPFGALDAQTRSEMQRFLLAMWKESHPTVLFVTHDVEEAVLLADRVVVMSARPGRIALDIRVHAPRPRQWDFGLSREFTDLKRQVLHALRPDDYPSRIG